MTPLKFWKRKLPLTLAWILVCAAMGVLLSTGFSLYDTMRGLPDFVEKNNKTVALIGESHLISRDEDGFAVTAGGFIEFRSPQGRAVPVEVVDLEQDALHFRMLGQYPIQQFRAVVEGKSDPLYPSLCLYFLQELKLA